MENTLIIVAGNVKGHLKSMTLNELAENVHFAAVEKGWWDGERPMGDVIANIHSELSEAWEFYRSGMSLTEVHYTGNNKPDGFAIELADTIIRILDLSARLGLDMDALVAEKMDYNQSRPHRHGGKLA
jgi:hypothetical protein